MKHLKIYEEISNLESTEPLLTMDTEENPELLKFVNNKPPLMKGTWKKLSLEGERMYVFNLTSGKINTATLAPMSDISGDFPMSGIFEIERNSKVGQSFGGYTCSLYK